MRWIGSLRWKACRGLIALLPLAALAAVTPPEQNQGAFQTGNYRNLFSAIGKSSTDVNAKVNAAWSQYFSGSDNNKTLFWRLNDDEYYILNAADNDVRSEGMSYAMMIAVQLNKPVEFDHLWRFAKKRMKQTSGDHVGYFCWRANPSGTCLDKGAAPDGEEYFAMALLFAANRWGVTSYRNDAHELLTAMLKKPVSGIVKPMFNLSQNQVVFSPVGGGADFTDPSYHLPAFYELFARWGPSADKLSWEAIRNRSRDFFHDSSNDSTCLAPEYANFDGSAHPGYNPATNQYDRPDQRQFRNDAWRVAFNWALDYAWFAADTRQPALSNCLLGFFIDPARGGGITVSGSSYSANFWHYYNLNGQLNVAGLPNLNPASGGTNYRADGGLIGMNAAAVLAAKTNENWPLDFVHLLWASAPPTGTYRYYSGLLYTLGTLATAGQYRIYAPPAAQAGVDKIVNGGFGNGLANWQTSVTAPATATFGLLDGAANVYVGNAGSTAYGVQFFQSLAVKSGKRYRLDFDARIKEGSSRAISVKLEKNGSPYTQYGASNFTLDRTLRHFSVSFGPLSANDAGARLTFQLGANSSDLQLDNVVLLEQ